MSAACLVLCLALPVLSQNRDCGSGEVFPFGAVEAASPSSDETLVKGLIAVLDETKSGDTFCLTVQVLASLKTESWRAIPAILRSAERLGISESMGNDPTRWTKEQLLLNAVVQPDLNHLRSMLKQAAPTAGVVPIRSANNEIILTGYVVRAEDVPVVLATAERFLAPDAVTPPECSLSSDKKETKVILMISPHVELEPELGKADEELLWELNRILRKRFGENRQKVQIVPPSQVRAYQDKQTTPATPRAVGEHYKADYVVNLETALKLNIEGVFEALLAGNAAITVTVTDCHAPSEANRVFWKEYARQYPKGGAMLADGISVAVFRRQFLTCVAEELAGYFTGPESSGRKAAGVSIINALSAPTLQVQMDVCIAEVANAKLPSFASFINTKGRHSTDNLCCGLVKDGKQLRGLLQALRTEGLAKVLAEPRLITQSGKSAHFLSGGQVAVPESSTNEVTFKDFGTQLTLFPTVLGNGKIYLEIQPRVDVINAACTTSISGTTIPAFNTQDLFATVEMEPEQTFAVVFPAANPSGGAADSQGKKGLLFVVTPHLVDPAAANDAGWKARREP